LFFFFGLFIEHHDGIINSRKFTLLFCFSGHCVYPYPFGGAKISILSQNTIDITHLIEIFFYTSFFLFYFYRICIAVRGSIFAAKKTSAYGK
ncbi:MAG: hypothetical protein IIW06_02265, partial [Bacteroidaceae bacterium]|nr:hypothetical protein [Bacteroidaceae bacterium]